MLEQRKHFGRKIRQARNGLRMKQEQVAAYLRIPISAVSAVESGRRKVDAFELYKLSKLLCKPMGWFFDEPQ